MSRYSSKKHYGLDKTRNRHYTHTQPRGRVVLLTTSFGADDILFHFLSVVKGFYYLIYYLEGNDSLVAEWGWRLG